MDNDEYDFDAERESLKRRYEQGNISREEFSERLGILLVRECVEVR